jgi:hypothetical protein
MTDQQIARRLGVAKATVGKWRRRFVQHVLTGLHDELRSLQGLNLALFIHAQPSRGRC